MIAPARTVVEDTELDELRASLDRVDDALLELIARRHALAREVGAAKRARGLPVLDPGREAAVVRRAAARARELGPIEEEVRRIYWHLIGLCRAVQLEEA